MMQKTNDEVIVTGLWIAKKKDGELFLRGNLGNCNVLVFSNNSKRNEQSPDKNLVIAEDKYRGNDKKGTKRHDTHDSFDDGLDDGYDDVPEDPETENIDLVQLGFYDDVVEGESNNEEEEEE